MFITNNTLCIILGCNLEISAFMFTFGSVTRKSLAKLRNNLSEHPTTESTLLEEEALFEFFLPMDVLWMNVMISCYALSCWAQFCILTDSTLAVKGFSVFFQIPDSSRRGLFAKKCSRMMFCLTWQYLVSPGTVIQSVVDRKFFLSCWLLKTHSVCTSQLTNLSFSYTWSLNFIFLEKNLWQFL